MGICYVLCSFSLMREHIRSAPEEALVPWERRVVVGYRNPGKQYVHHQGCLLSRCFPHNNDAPTIHQYTRGAADIILRL